MAQTLAELLIRIKTEGSQAVKRELRDIEESLRKANAASERNIKSFERTQNRIIAGQKRMMTSGGGGGASSMGVDPKQLDAVTDALRNMSAPLNAVLDGFTQFGQIFAVGSARASINISRLTDALKDMKENTLSFANEVKNAGVFSDVMSADPSGRYFGLGASPLGKIGMKSMVGTGVSAGFIDPELVDRIEAHNRAIDRLDEKEERIFALEGKLDEQRRASLPIWERLNNAQKTGIVLGAAYIATLASMTNELVKFAVGASKAGVEYESMRARIEGMDKKGSTTAQIFGLARSVAGPTKFTTKQMEEASVSLLAYGVNVERTLPLIGKLGQAFGADQEKLNQYTRAFGMLAAGQMPDSEVLGAMGVTKSALAKEGIKFDKGGGLISSTETVMVALEKIINTKYAKVIKETANTTEALRASVQDSFEGIQRYMGIAVNDGIKPFEKTLGNVLSMLEMSTFPEQVATNLISPIVELQGNLKTLEEQMKYTIAVFAALGTLMPKNLSSVIKDLKDSDKQDVVTGFFTKMGIYSTALPRLLDPTGFTTGSGGLGGLIDGYLKSMDKKRTLPGPNNKRAKDPFGGQLPFKGEESDGSKNKKTLEKIENNTRKSAELLDLRRQTIGGGEIASLGITGAEIAGMGLKNRSEISLRSPIRPDTQVIRGIKDLVYGNMNFALQGSPINRVRF